MLTLRQFMTMTESYGADLRRWPEDVRHEAAALLHTSAAARAAHYEAKKLDDAITTAGRKEDAILFPSSKHGAALARLRSTVAARTATAGRQESVDRRWRSTLRTVAWPLSTPLRWVGLAACSGFAVAAGILVGVTYPAPTPSNTVLMMLQAAPINILAD